MVFKGSAAQGLKFCRVCGGHFESSNRNNGSRCTGLRVHVNHVRFTVAQNLKRTFRPRGLIGECSLCMLCSTVMLQICEIRGAWNRGLGRMCRDQSQWPFSYNKVQRWRNYQNVSNQPKMSANNQVLTSGIRVTIEGGRISSAWRSERRGGGVWKFERGSRARRF